MGFRSSICGQQENLIDHVKEKLLKCLVDCGQAQRLSALLEMQHPISTMWLLLVQEKLLEFSVCVKHCLMLCPCGSFSAGMYLKVLKERDRICCSQCSLMAYGAHQSSGHWVKKSHGRV